MSVYDRSHPDEFVVVDRWERGVGWQVHPDEPAARTSHAVRTEDGVWLLDPLDAPGLDNRLADLGPVAGVAVLSNWHSRDAGPIARRHDVPVTVPAWMTRVDERVSAPVERVDGAGPVAGFDLELVEPFPGWREAIAYRASDGTLYTPDLLTTARRVGSERVSLTLLARLVPPRDRLPRQPARILVGHGQGVFTDASEALADALAGARRRLPRALVRQGPSYLRGMIDAVRSA